MTDRDELVAAFERRAAAEREEPVSPTPTRSPDDPWPMRVLTHGEAEWCYEQRRFLKRTSKEIARELGKSVKSIERGIGYIALERGTYGSAWKQEWRDYKRERCHWFLRTVTEQRRKDAIAKQSAAEHVAMVELTRATLDSPPPRETRAEREERAEREAMSGTVRIVSANGDRMDDGHGREALRRSPSEREARRKAARIRQMLGPTARADELGL